MKKYFKVFETDDYGKPKYYLGVFTGESKLEAKQKAAIHYDNPEIVSTGFYDTEESTLEILNKKYYSRKRILEREFELFI